MKCYLQKIHFFYPISSASFLEVSNYIVIIPFVSIFPQYFFIIEERYNSTVSFGSAYTYNPCGPFFEKQILK